MIVYEYKFQHNNDITSCFALADMIQQGWTIEGLKKEDGYTWLILRRTIYEKYDRTMPAMPE